ncbi:hypothetical protein PINS_up020978 [Pythium insidiosum]|nr:hypothetical protein PINS_up020978 [Pythium insidiosum]
MSEFVRHTRETNDIFLLAAKVIARVLCRFLVSRDLIKAREPMDMFYKKPWWEVVMMERQVQQQQQRQARGVDDASGGGSNSHSSYSSGSGSSPDTDDATARTNDRTNNGFDDGAATDASHSPASSASGESQCLKDLLMSTHQLLADALECNLVHLEREDQLHGFTVDEIWTSCASVLSFEFFAAQLGLFEMNNIRVEVDHPFQALMEVLENDGRDLDPPSRHPLGNDDDDDDGANANGHGPHHPRRHGHGHGAVGDAASPSTPTSELSTEDRELFERVRAVLAFAAEECITQQLAALDRDDLLPSTAEAAAASMQLRGFPSVDGTALFPIVCTMNHSCDPNCTVLYTKNGDAHVVAVRDIPRGEELCICYVDVDQDVHQREASLREYQFRCFCRRCTTERRTNLHAVATGQADDGDADCDCSADSLHDYESRRTRSDHPYHSQQHMQHMHHSYSQRSSHGDSSHHHTRQNGHDRSRNQHHHHHHYHNESTHNCSHSS